jgi:hypothetical protein
MNTSTISRVISAQWVRRSIVAAGMVLLAGAAALGLAGRANIITAPSAPAIGAAPSLSAAYQRYEDFKLRQVDQVGVAIPRTMVATAARQRYENFKLRQADRLEGSGSAAAPAATRRRYEDFKLRQVDQAAAASDAVGTTAAQTRFDEFKRQQLERAETKSGDGVPVVSPAREHFYDFKRRQIDQTGAGVR